MPRVATPLNHLQIVKAKEKEKAYTLADGQGLQILIAPDGRKSWEYIYTSPLLHKRRKTSFGVFPSVTLEKARQKRLEWQNLLQDGIDPLETKKELALQTQKTIESDFENVVYAWFESQKTKLQPITLTKKINLFNNTVLPILKNKSIREIKHDELVHIIKIKSLQTPETAKRLLGYFHDLWQFACTHGYCEYNIVPNIHAKSILPKITKKHYSCITDPEILKQLTRSIYTYGGHVSTKNALKFVLHVPLRAGNLVSLRWQYINFEKATLTIPRKEMKAKTGEDFTLPLTDEAINILKEQYPFTSNNEFIFVADTGNHLDEVTPSRALQRMGFNNETLGNKQRLHSFRSTFRSLADTYQMSHKCSFEAKEKILDHAIGSEVERAYTHKANYMDEMRILLTWWSQYIINTSKVTHENY